MVMRVLLLCAVLLAPVSTVPAQGTVTVGEVLDRMAAALGGRERLARLSNVETRFAIEAAGLKGTGESLVTARGETRVSYDLGGIAGGLNVYDGRTGWARDAKGKVRERGGPELEDEATGVYLGSYSHLVPGRLPGRVELAGENAGGTHYLVRAAAEGGDAVTLHVDKATFLVDRVELTNDGQTSVTSYEDWREVDGVRFAFRSRQSTGDAKYEVVVTVTSVRTNVPLDATAFARPSEGAADFGFAKGTSAEAIPFEMTENHIFVPVRVNGSEPLWFIFDTGAEMTVVETSRAKAIGLQLAGSVQARGNGEGTLEAAFVKGVTLALAGAEVRDQTVVAIPLGGLEPFEGRKIDGIVGYDFVSRFVVEIDYAARRMSLHDPKTYAYKGAGERLPIELVGNLPHVRATMVGPGGATSEGRFLVDTGSRLAISLNSPFVRANAWALEAAERSVDAPYGVGVGGASKTRVGRLESFRLGRHAVARPVAGFTFDTKGAKASADAAGAIGGEILRRFTVVFDYSRLAMYLEPGRDFAEPFEYDMLGAQLKLEGSAFVVHRVVAGSAAEAAGLAAGDAILAVDGRPSAGLSLEEVRRMFRVDGGSHALAVRTGDTTREVKVVLKRIL